MLDSVFQLSGAIMTIYSIFSMTSRDLRDAQLLNAPAQGVVSPKINQKRKERTYTIVGGSLIILGYSLPTAGFDISLESPWYMKVVTLIVLTSIIVASGIGYSNIYADHKAKSDKPFDPQRDVFGIK